MLDALFALAREGVDGVNMHTLPRSAYELFKFSHAGGHWSATVAPVYYGLDMFARAARAGLAAAEESTAATAVRG